MIIPFTTDPNLDILKLRPRARASSFPLNHFDTIADWPTDIDSPPKPNITLPASIIPKFFLYPPRVNTAYPAVKTPEKRRIPNLKPTMSKNMPPKMGNTVLG